MATAGDVNGDGYADVVVGASGLQQCTPGGRMCIWAGRRPGDDGGHDPDWRGDQQLLRRVGGDGGDVNGDGYADVVVGAYGYSSGTGRAYVYLGGASGLAAAPATTLTGEAATDYFGMSVATAGDVNGDGYADVVVGAQGYSSDTGRAYVYPGRCERPAKRRGGSRGIDDPDGRGDLQLFRPVGGDGGRCERRRLRGRRHRGVWLQQSAPGGRTCMRATADSA